MNKEQREEQAEKAKQAEWAGRAMGLRALYKALRTVEINNLDLDEILLGTADALDTMSMPITVVRPK